MEAIKIILEDKQGKQQIFTEGIVIYTVNNDQDLEAAFVNIDSLPKIRALLRAIEPALKMAEEQFAAAAQIESVNRFADFCEGKLKK